MVSSSVVVAVAGSSAALRSTEQPELSHAEVFVTIQKRALAWISFNAGRQSHAGSHQRGSQEKRLALDQRVKPNIITWPQPPSVGEAAVVIGEALNIGLAEKFPQLNFDDE